MTFYGLSIILDFAGFLPLIYPIELEVKETTDTASYMYYRFYVLRFTCTNVDMY